MPTYEYECENKHRFEKWQSMKDDALTECVICGSPVRRILHPAGIIFKGSGWYITDSRSPSSESKAESSSSTKSESKSEAKDSKESKETKSEPKSESAASTESKPSVPKPTTE